MQSLDLFNPLEFLFNTILIYMYMQSMDFYYSWEVLERSLLEITEFLVKIWDFQNVRYNSITYLVADIVLDFYYS